MAGWAYVDVQARIRYERRNAIWKILGDFGLESEIIEETIRDYEGWINHVTYNPENVEMECRQEEAIYMWSVEMGRRLGICYPPIQPPEVVA